MKNLKLKGLKYNTGKYELYTNRFVFFPPQIIEILSSIYGEGVKSLLVWLGKKAGWNLSQNWEENLRPKSLDDLVNQFCNTLNNQGWGYFIAKEISDKAIIIQVDHLISSQLESETKTKYVCYYLTGLMTGFGEFALYRVSVSETKCCIEDPSSSHCEFKIEKTL